MEQVKLAREKGDGTGATEEDDLDVWRLAQSRPTADTDLTWETTRNFISHPKATVGVESRCLHNFIACINVTIPARAARKETLRAKKRVVRPYTSYNPEDSHRTAVVDRIMI